MTKAVPRTDLRIEIIQDEAAFERIKVPWNALAAQAAPSVFLRHEWFSAAWAWRRMDAALWIPCVYSGDTLVAALPLVRAHKTGHSDRVIRFLSVPDTQYCDALAEPRNAYELCAALVEHLVSLSAEWDELCLERLPPQSIVAAVLKPLLEKCTVKCTLESPDCNLYINLQGTWDDYVATRSRSFKKALNLAANRIARLGKVEVERLHADNTDHQQLQSFLDAVLLISERSWKRATGKTLNMPGPRAFIHCLTQSAYASKWLSMWLLKIDGRPIAMEYQIVYDRKVHALRADFDDDYKKVSPGSFLNRQLVEQLLGTGYTRYYMGPGRNSYKTRWSMTGEPLRTLIAYSPTLRGQALSFWPHDVKPRLRKLRDRLTPLVAICACFWSTWSDTALVGLSG